MSEADKMSPDKSPGETQKTGVRRVNNMPMYMIGGVVGLFLLVMVMVASDRSSKSEVASGPKSKAGNTSMFAKEIAGDKTGGMIEPAKPLDIPDMPTAQNTNPNTDVPVDGAPKILVAKPSNLDAPPTPSAQDRLAAPGGRLTPSQQQQQEDEEANRIRQAKQQLFQEAVKAKTGVQLATPRSAASQARANPTEPKKDAQGRLADVRQQIEAQRDKDPTAVFQARLAQIRAMGLLPTSADVSGAPGGMSSAGPSGGQPATTGASGNPNQRNGMAQFGTTASPDRWKLNSGIEAPRSPFELRAAAVIPATLISGINSQLPGPIMGQVAQDVYDTATGKNLLVPQGSRLVGAYSSDVAYGQSRVLVAWQRIVFPDGKALDLGAMPGADSAGYAGYNDQVNNHYVRLFASAFLLSGVTAGITYTQRQGQVAYGVPSTSSALSEALGQQLGQVTTELLRKNMNIAPTLEIRPGYRFNVIVTKDLTFARAYKSFDY